MQSATLYTLQRFDWQFFGTLTFRSERVPERARVNMWHAFAVTVGQWAYRRPRPRIIWALRLEAGEITGRLHFHYLFGGLPPSFQNTTTCISMMKRWEAMGGVRGMARVREYKPESGGDTLDYIDKCLSGANFYEQVKFHATGERIMIADTVWNAVGLVCRTRKPLPESTLLSRVGTASLAA